jgi:hypothetical protein
MCPTSSVLAFCLLAAEAGQSWLFSSFVCNQESEMERQKEDEILNALIQPTEIYVQRRQLMMFETTVHTTRKGR